MDIKIMAIITAALFGAVFGSFAGAMVWRLRAMHTTKGPVKLAKLKKRPISKDRSCCLSCGHTLQLVDLLPVISWLMLRGKCRYCKAPIGLMELLLESGTALYFVLVTVVLFATANTATDWFNYALWLVAGVPLAILFAYDARWYILPDRVVWPLVGIGALRSFVELYTSGFSVPLLVSILGGVMILSGLYLALWTYSKGKWIGFGDVKLGLALALLLADWQLAFFTLFVANCIGLLLVVPGMLLGKIKRTSRIPFGPMLIVAAIIVYLCKDAFHALMQISLYY